MTDNKLSRRAFLAATTTTALTGAACSLFIKPTSPGVVFIVIDTLRADRLDAKLHNLPVMPGLHALADNAVCCAEAYVQETFTKPSVASMLTSLYPEVHGVRFGIFTPGDIDKSKDPQSMLHVDVLSRELPSLPTVLRQHGYATIGVQTNMQLHAHSGFANGFDQYHYLDNVSADVVSRKAISAIERVKEPFFLYIHYLDPHCPYTPPKEIIHTFGVPEKPSDKDLELLQNYNEYYWDLVRHGLGLSEERAIGRLGRKGRNFLKFMYDGEARFTDSEVAGLIASVRKRFPRSLIVVTSDHGEEFWEHGSIGHTKTAYRELAHVPLIFAAPGLAAANINAPVESIDITPTIAAYLDIPLESGWQGRNLIPLFTGTGRRKQKCVYTSAFGMQPWDKVKWRAVYDGEHRLVKNFSQMKTELFNIANDPYEKKSLAEKEPGRIEELTKALDAIIEANERHPLKQERWKRQGLRKGRLSR